MPLYALPNEVLLEIISHIPLLFCVPLVVACAPELMRRGMMQPLSRPELLAMHRLAHAREPPRLGRKPAPHATDYFQSLPSELWLIVGSSLRTEDKLDFAAAVWQGLAPQWVGTERLKVERGCE